jgi:hypothetical protein
MGTVFFVQLIERTKKLVVYSLALNAESDAAGQEFHCFSLTRNLFDNI